MTTICGREIGLNKEPYVIAELSANHNGSLEKAKKTILKAKECGADAIKIQTYTADSMTIDCDKNDFQINSGLWKGYKLYDLYKGASTPYSWHKDLFAYAKNIGITIFSSPFDMEAVDFLEGLGAPAYKIASFELVDLDLIEYVASKKKPIFMSTGMASISEIRDAVLAAQQAGCKDLILFHCISSYPTPTSEANINMVKFLREEFNVQVGLSDHTLTDTAAIAAVAMGASVIEKHFTLTRLEKGPDSDFSIEPRELKNLIKNLNDCSKATREISFKRSKYEVQNKSFRRSLYFVKDLNANDIITPDSVRKIRPGYGLPPKFYKEIINKRVTQNVKRGERVTWEKVIM